MTTPAMSAAVSPLHRIRQSEAESAQRIAAARREAELASATASAQADAIVVRAREDGRREGERLYAERIASAQHQSQALISEARLLADERLRSALPLVPAAADYIAGIVLGAGQGMGR